MTRLSSAAKLRIIANVALDAPTPREARSARELRDWIVTRLTDPDDSVSYLILAVLYERIPRVDLVEASPAGGGLRDGSLLRRHLSRFPGVQAWFPADSGRIRPDDRRHGHLTE